MERPNRGVIQVVDTTTPIAANASDLGATTKAFLESDLPSRGIYPTIAFAGRPAAPPTLARGRHPKGPAGTVSREELDLANGSAAAVVRANRAAVVLLKVSFDPGWTATVDGKNVAPQMVAPALVGVRVPPGTHRVVFTYRGYGSYPLLFAVAVVTLVAVGAGPALWRRRGRAAAAPTPDAVAAATD